MSGVAIYRTPIAPEWIDYNGHVRDAYYGLIASYAVDSLMDKLGMDEPYRSQSGCTLYTVEMHTHFLREISVNDTVEVRARILGVDEIRLHAALELVCDGGQKPAATCEVMLLHVYQTPTVRAAPFPQPVAAAIAELRRATAAMAAAGPGSRHMALPSK
ncbi:MAG TPA: thioesterase family protein [Steroidobacteraceae bacterium]|nr:thioesterase family protein [Steroidobacteraceae bacterium]